MSEVLREELMKLRRGPDEFVFQNEGRPISYHSLKSRFKTDQKRAGVRRSGLGLQGGAGFQINEHLSVEALLKVLTLSIEAKSGNVTTDCGTGYMAGTQLNLKFDF